MSVTSENILFDWRIRSIVSNAREIESATHLFDGLTLYDTALDRLDLRLSARRLRDAADKLDGISDRLQGPETAFPEHREAAE